MNVDLSVVRRFDGVGVTRGENGYRRDAFVVLLAKKATKKKKKNDNKNASASKGSGSGFGGGGGAGMKAARQPPASSSSTTSSSSAPSAPSLDRFGLPAKPTFDSIFPPPSLPIKKPLSPNFPPATLPQEFRDLAGESISEEWAKCQVLCEQPLVLKFANVGGVSECKSVIEDSSTVSTASPTFSSAELTKRTSVTFYTPPETVPSLHSFVTKLFPGREDCFEDYQMVRYEEGGEFSYHLDNVPNSSSANGGDRICTCLLYLTDNTPESGTIFRDIPLMVQPVAGDFLIFFNRYDNSIDDRVLHRGGVVEGRKMAAQLWVHERPYDTQLN